MGVIAPVTVIQADNREARIARCNLALNLNPARFKAEIGDGLDCCYHMSHLPVSSRLYKVYSDVI
jgi:hypothetical protein